MHSHLTLIFVREIFWQERSKRWQFSSREEGSCPSEASPILPRADCLPTFLGCRKRSSFCGFSELLTDLAKMILAGFFFWLHTASILRETIDWSNMHFVTKHVYIATMQMKFVNRYIITMQAGILRCKRERCRWKFLSILPHGCITSMQAGKFKSCLTFQIKFRQLGQFIRLSFKTPQESPIDGRFLQPVFQ